MHSNQILLPLARVILIVLVITMIGACGGAKNPAMSLQFADRVFVLINPDTLPGIAAGSRIASTAKNLHLQFVHIETTFDTAVTAPAIVIYSNVRYVPVGTAYAPTRVITLYDAALDDSVASGITVNPNINGAKSYVMTKSDIKSAIPRIMQHKPLPFEVHIAGKN